MHKKHKINSFNSRFWYIIVHLARNIFRMRRVMCKEQTTVWCIEVTNMIVVYQNISPSIHTENASVY